MAEVLADFDIRLPGPDGRVYEPQACGRAREDGLWEGWVEFAPDQGPPLRTARETTQPNREDTVYWAQGLTTAYLEGALQRALGDRPRVPVKAESAGAPAFEGPAPELSRSARAQPRPVLDPFRVYGEGVEVLRAQLRALSEPHLRTIVRAHGFTPKDLAALDALTRAELTELIIRGVEREA